MHAVTDQPDAPRDDAREDPSHEGSGWLARALSGRRQAGSASEVQQGSSPPQPSEPGGVAASAGPQDEQGTRDWQPGGADAAADDGPDHALSPLNPPPMPATPTGVVRWWTAGATLAAGGLLSVAGYASVQALAAAALLVVAVLAWGWPTLVDLPSPRGSTAVVALGGAAAVVAVALSEDEPLLQWLALALAGAVVVEFVHQLARRDGRPRLVEGMTGTLAGVVVLASLSSWLALPRTDVGASGVLLVAVPVAIGLALQALPVPGRLTAVAGVVLTALLSGLVAGLVPEPTVVAGLVTGLVAGSVAAMLHRLLSVLPPAGSAPAWLAVALAPLASTGMVSYVALRLLVG
jgi:hypothetical protein